MKTNILATAVALSDRDLLARIDTLASTEREAMAELVAHLTALELRPSLYLAEGYGSLFDYCTRALRLSEDAACTRIAAVRACGRFPVILDYLASGAMNLTSVRLLGPHLTAENHEAVLARASGTGRGQIEALVAELAPRPDVRSSVRKLPTPKGAGACPVPTTKASSSGAATLIDMSPDTSSQAAAILIDGSPNVSSSEADIDQDPGREERPESQASPAVLPPQHRPIVRALAPERFRVQFTIGQQAHDKLRRVQALLRREIPNGDPGVIFERGLDLVLAKVEKAKLGVVANPRRRASDARLPGGAYEKRIRFRTDKAETRHSAPPGDVPREVKSALTRHERPPSRHIPNAVKRAVWRRDGGQCAFVSDGGRRCAERHFLELHHIQPYALDGPATIGNVSLRCRRHNAYEGELVFGPRDPSMISEGRELYGRGPMSG
jgi:5-methylcytosine-specific restriction endonuclease McrA